MSDNDIAEFAKRLMDELGYGSQPYVVYKHGDIKRIHYHVVSVRVDENGRKINDFREGKKCNRALCRMAKEFGYKVGKGQDSKVQEPDVYKGFVRSAGNYSVQFEQLVAHAMRYHITTESQLRMVLNSLNVDVDYKKKRGVEYMVFYGLDPKTKQRCTGGILSRKLKVTGALEIQKHLASCKKAIKRKEKRRVASIVRSLLPHSKSEVHFQRMLAKTGISVHFLQAKEGRLYDVTFIDHQTKCCFKSVELPQIPVSLFEEARLQHWQEAEKGNGKTDLLSDSIGDIVGIVQELACCDGVRRGEDEEMMRRGRRRRR